MDIQWHTEARQQPHLIGKDSSGRKIPGGPYTIYQVIAVIVVVPLIAFLAKITAGHITISGVIFALAAGWFAVFLVGRVDWTWSPLAWLEGWWRVTSHAVTTPAGTTAGVLGSTKFNLPKNTRTPRPTVWAATSPIPETVEEPDDPVERDQPTSLLDDFLAEDHSLGPAAEDIDDPVEQDQPTALLDHVFTDNPESAHPEGGPVRLSGLEAFLAAARKET